MDPSPDIDPGEAPPASMALPWAFSTAAHAGLLLAPALLWSPRVYFGDGDSGLSLDTQLDLSQAWSTGGGQPDGTDSGGSGTRQGFFDDQPSNGEAARIGPSVQDALAAVVSEKPPADFEGLLPAASGGGPQGLPESSVASAGRSTSGGGPSKGLGGGLGGGYATTSVFGVSGKGRKFVYVFDCSGSMSGHGGAPLAAAKAQLIQSLEDLDQTHQFQIIFYNDQPYPFIPTGGPGRLCFATEQNKALARQFIDRVTADGGTQHEAALQMALRLKPDVIFFLTDADEPRLTSGQMLHIEQLNHGSIINAIEYGFGVQADNENFLVRLARQNSGKHKYVNVASLKNK